MSTVTQSKAGVSMYRSVSALQKKRKGCFSTKASTPWCVEQVRGMSESTMRQLRGVQDTADQSTSCPAGRRADLQGCSEPVRTFKVTLLDQRGSCSKHGQSQRIMETNHPHHRNDPRGMSISGTRPCPCALNVFHNNRLLAKQLQPHSLPARW